MFNMYLVVRILSVGVSAAVSTNHQLFGGSLPPNSRRSPLLPGHSQKALHQHHARISSARELEYKYVSEPLNMNCNGQVGYPCQLYMQEFLNTYVNINHSYNKIILPVENRGERVDIDVVITFVDLVNVDTVSGTMTVYVFIDYIWKDVHMRWDPALTDNDDFIVIPNDLLWIPDIILYNAVNGFDSHVDETAVFLDATGVVWWSGRGVFTFSCTYDVNDFPFDSQTCTAEFSSWIYSLNNINITTAQVDVLSSFSNLAWEIDDVSGRRETKLLWGGAYTYTFGLYDVTITRYYSHYVSSAIIPAVVITIIVLASLWMKEFSSRLSLSVTGLLTMIAIQWSVADSLPISKSSNWLGRFLIMCIVFIASVSIECYVSAMMYNRKHNEKVPRWVVFLINASLYHEYLSKRLGEGGGAEQADHTEKENFELRSFDNNPLSMPRPMQHTFEDGQNIEDTEVTTTSPNDSGIGRQDSVAGARTSIQRQREYSWQRASRALDRICRVLIPLVYVLMCSIFLGRKIY